jgi:hypothetical protein
MGHKRTWSFVRYSRGANTCIQVLGPMHRVRMLLILASLVSVPVPGSQSLAVIWQRYERGDTVPLTESTTALEISKLKLGPSGLNGS